jgi:hypothetical protein
MRDYPGNKSYKRTYYKKDEEHNKHTPNPAKTNAYYTNNTNAASKELDIIEENFFDEIHCYCPTFHDYALFVADIISLIIAVLLSSRYYTITPGEYRSVIILFPCAILINILVSRFVGVFFAGVGVGWLLIQIIFCLFLI